MCLVLFLCVLLNSMRPLELGGEMQFFFLFFLGVIGLHLGWVKGQGQAFSFYAEV